MKSILIGVLVFCWMMIILILGGVSIDEPNKELGYSIAISTIISFICFHLCNYNDQ